MPSLQMVQLYDCMDMIYMVLCVVDKDVIYQTSHIVKECLCNTQFTLLLDV